jgi:membrane-bound lytic murein transglycosylase B
MRYAATVAIILSLSAATGCGSSASKDGVAATRPGKPAPTLSARADLNARGRQMAIDSVGYRTSAPAAIPAVAGRVGGDFAGYPAVDSFIRRMEQRHGFDPDALAGVLSRAQREQWIIDQMDRPMRKSKSTGPNGAWSRYRAKFLTPDNISKGVRFWQRYEPVLQRAAGRYGVPPEHIVGILGVETRWGGYMGKTRIIDALATLAFAYPRRADYFSGELESYLVMARDEGFDPFKPVGSFAGAMGLGQFMPSSFHNYAVDFSGDGHRDLWNPVDAIGSVANYFKGHGWRPGEPVAVRAQVTGPSAGLMKTGFDTSYSLGSLADRGVTPAGSLGGSGTASLLKLDAGDRYEYWLGLNNFYVITRYNHSTYYAMAVYQLGQAVKAQKGGPGSTRISQLPVPGVEATL